MRTIIRGWRGMLGGAGLLASGLLTGCESTPRRQTISTGAPMVSRNGTVSPSPAWNTGTQPGYATAGRPIGATQTSMGSMSTPGTMSGMSSTGSMGMTSTPSTGMETMPSRTVPGMTNPASFSNPPATAGPALSPTSSLPASSGVSQTGYGAPVQPTRLSAAPTYSTSGAAEPASNTTLPPVPQPPMGMNSSVTAPQLPSTSGMPTMPGR